jgi:predicted helicase
VDEVVAAGSILGTAAAQITPNEYGDWINQRRDDFEDFFPIGSKSSEDAIFEMHSLGLASGRDSWVYNSSAATVSDSVQKLVANYNHEVDAAAQNNGYQPDRDPSRISWNRNLEQAFSRGRKIQVDVSSARRFAQYRPFFRQWLCFDVTG